MPANRKRTSLAWLVVSALSVPTIVAFGCTPAQKADPAPSASAPSSSAPAATASASVAKPEPRGGDEIRPVYPLDAGAPDPLAQRFCDAVQLLPEQRKAECCGGSAVTAQGLSAQCVRTLTFALGQRAVTLAPADVDACVAAVTKATSGCDWVTGFGFAMPPECDGIIKGTLAEKATCRSSLECAEGMRCIGLSTVDLGTCGKPKETRAMCNIANDMMATFTRQDGLERAHPECEGFCAYGHCFDAVAEGGACKSDRECGSARCEAGKCTRAKLPAVGEACAGACAYGARCLAGKCVAPKAEGEACSANEECRGMCARGDGGAGGTCSKTCAVTSYVKVSPPQAPAKKGR
jgi:hypothetical protein